MFGKGGAVLPNRCGGGGGRSGRRERSIVRRRGRGGAEQRLVFGRPGNPVAPDRRHRSRLWSRRGDGRPPVRGYGRSRRLRPSDRAKHLPWPSPLPPSRDIGWIREKARIPSVAAGGRPGVGISWNRRLIWPQAVVDRQGAA